jgi:O-antigen/teichoic acid export membrane protein
LSDDKKLHKKTGSYIWSAIDILSTKVFQLLITILLARILAPEQFGLVAIVLIIIAILQVFVESGLSTSLLRTTDIKRIEYNSVWLFNLFISVFLALILFILSANIAEYYGAEELEALCKVASLNILLSALIIVPKVKLAKEFKFKQISYSSITSSLVSGSFGVLAALNGAEYWAILLQYLMSNLLNALCLNLFARFKYSLEFDINVLAKHLKISMPILVAGLIDIVFKQGIQLLIGKHYNSKVLGLYNQADRISSLPIISLTQVVQRVNFQVLVNKGNDKAEKSINIMAQFIVYLFLPIISFLYFFGEQIINTLLGEHWSGSVIIFKNLLLAYFFIPIGSIFLNWLKIIGETKVYLKIELIKKLIFCSLIMITFHHGIVLITYSIILAYGLGSFVDYIFVKKFLSFDWPTFIKVSIFTLANTMISIYLITTLGYLDFSLFSLALNFTLYVLLYSFITFLFNSKPLKLFLDTIKS